MEGEDEVQREVLRQNHIQMPRGVVWIMSRGYSSCNDASLPHIAAAVQPVPFTSLPSSCHQPSINSTV